MFPLNDSGKGTEQMAFYKEIATAAGALAVAIGIGFVMQNSEAAQAHYGKDPAERPKTIAEANATNAVLDVQEISFTSAEFESTIALPEREVEVKKTAPPPSLPAIQAPPETKAPPSLAQPKLSCDVTAAARPMAAAMVELTLSAPCLPNERVTIHHNGMIFTETTSDNGALSLRVPALAKEAVFIAAFGNGEGAVAQARVEDLGDFQRAVLQWRGNTGFQIHAREFGAAYGEAGHLWHEKPGSIAAAVLGESGVLTRHGDMEAADPLLAEVYTFPVDANERSGAIALSVEAEVTELNCGIEIEAQSLEIERDGSINTRNLTLPVPDCDARGSFLVLNNLLQDLKVATR
jgi:hypothetical protein